MTNKQNYTFLDTFFIIHPMLCINDQIANFMIYIPWPNQTEFCDISFVRGHVYLHLRLHYKKLFTDLVLPSHLDWQCTFFREQNRWQFRRGSSSAMHWTNCPIKKPRYYLRKGVLLWITRYRVDEISLYRDFQFEIGPLDISSRITVFLCDFHFIEDTLSSI